MPNHNSQAQRPTSTLRLDDQLGIVSSDGLNSIPWPEHFSVEDWDATKIALDSYPTLLARSAKLKEALKECAKEREELIDGLIQGAQFVSAFRDRFFDEDPNEGCNGSPEYEELNTIRTHLEGSCIDNDGEYMARDKFAALLADTPEGDAK